MEFTIRKYDSKDRADIRRISCETAFLEYNRKQIFDDDEILADVFTLYFTDYEPDSCFVAVVDGRVIGYIIGTTDALTMKRLSRQKIAGFIFLKAFSRGVFFKTTNLKFLFSFLKSFLQGEFKEPSFLKDFPTMLHINVSKEFRDKGIGSKFIETYLNLLEEKKSKGVHFGTLSERAKNFYLKTGFTVLFHGVRSYLKPYIGESVNYYVLGRKLK